MEKMNFYSITPAALQEYFSSHGENPAKAGIIFDSVYRQGVREFSAVPFSERVRKKLTSDFSLALPEIASESVAEDSAKLLLKFADGEFAETVLMRQKFGCCACVSTQVGCAMGCAFCQSGRLKKRRNLSAGEIIAQPLALEKRFGVKISGISVMGIGEPFDNFSAVRDFCEIASAPRGMAVGQRHITVSTCGIVPKIYELAELEHPCNLAISLHAPNDELRSALMPINKQYPLSRLMTAAQHFSEKTNSRVTLEYTMLSGINDTAIHAAQLAKLIGNRRFYVNIIPYNQTEAEQFRKSSFEQIMVFYDVLKKAKIGVTMRREFGGGVNAACGQLRADYGK